MITEILEIYKCEHCRKLYQMKRYAVYHELMCKKNPENQRPCYGCIYLHKKKYELFHDGPYGEYSECVNIMHCKKKDIYLYTPQNEIKGNAYELGNHINDPMPKTCDMLREPDYKKYK